MGAIKHKTQHAALVDAGLAHLVLLPTDLAYAEREASYWAANARIQPAFIVRPRNTSEVSRIVKALADAPGNFAVRSGGHSHWAGGSNVHDGVTIDLGLMTGITYFPQTTIASIEPGPRWGEVYRELEAQGVCVCGGRVANVGVGGFLTGGGMSFYNGRTGMGCDSIANFEVVLASGAVVNANESENADLWKALKGGSGNFGIVTRFDIRTFPSAPVWGGMRASPRSAGDQIVDALVKFVDDNESHESSALLVDFTYNPGLSPEVLVATVIVDTLGVENGPAFEEMLKVPTVMEDVMTRTIEQVANAYLLPSAKHNVWFTLTFRNDPIIVKKVAELHDQLVAELKLLLPADAFVTECLFQPVPTYFARRSITQGGNVLGLDSVKANALLWLGTGTVKTAAHKDIIEPKMAEWAAAIEKFAEGSGGNVPWRYLNYADPSQRPLSSYGAANVKLMRDVSAKYDPEGVFQRKVPGGFKVSRAQ